MFLLKLIYILSVQISLACFITCFFSVNAKIKKNLSKKYYNTYSNLNKKDDGERVIIIMRLLLVCLCPILNTIISFTFSFKWEEVRDTSYQKMEKKIQDCIKKYPDKFFSNSNEKSK